jgi:hypothetical protein
VLRQSFVGAAVILSLWVLRCGGEVRPEGIADPGSDGVFSSTNDGGDADTPASSGASSASNGSSGARGSGDGTSEGDAGRESSSGSGPDVGSTCGSNGNCPVGRLCVLGACRMVCRTSTDCEPGGMCVDNGVVAVCLTAAEENVPCSQGGCPPPLACASDYRCRNPCTTSADCNVDDIFNEVCALGTAGMRGFCADPSDVNDAGILSDQPPPGAPDTLVSEP